LADAQAQSLFKAKLFNFFKWVMGGEKFYIGRPLKEIHWGLRISDELFDKTTTQIIQAARSTRPKLKIFRQFSKIVSDLRPIIVSPIP